MRNTTAIPTPMPTFAPVLSPPLPWLLVVEVLLGSGTSTETVCVITEAGAEVAEDAEIVIKEVAVPPIWMAYDSSH